MQSGTDILFIADTLIDIDFGLLRFIRNKYSNSNIMDKDKLNKSDLYFQEYLMSKCKLNILEELLSDEYNCADNIIRLYEEIMTKYYDEIVQLSPVIDETLKMYNTHLMSQFNTNIIPLVLCKTESEIEYFKKFPGIKCIICEDKLYDEDFYLRFTRIVIRNIYDISRYKLNKLGGKNILVLFYYVNFNNNDKYNIPEQYVRMFDINEIETILPYKYEEALG